MWDVAVKPMDPLVSVALTEDSALTSVTFASNASVVVVQCDAICLSIYLSVCLSVCLSVPRV